MQYDDYGRPHVNSKELCDLLYQQPDLKLELFEVDDPEQYNTGVQSLYLDIPKLKRYSQLSKMSLEEFDAKNQDAWHMPASYREMDIAKWLLDQCQEQHELQRIGEELLLYQERNLLDLLRYMKYLVDTMRKHGILWGVGRGSSVASYALYLIGVHRINSIYYDLDIKEFLK